MPGKNFPASSRIWPSDRLPIRLSLSRLSQHRPRHVRQFRSYGTGYLSDDALAREDCLAHARGHHRVAVDQWKQETEVLLRAAKVITQRRAPGFTIGAKRVLKMPLLQRLDGDVGGEQGRPAVGIHVFCARGEESARGTDQQRAIRHALL